MVFINEWLPNPNGADAKGEFVELFNNGSATVNLDGWVLKTTAKKSFSLSGYSVAANGYLVLKKDETKLSLKNNGETVSLYNATGRLVDQSAYTGAAPSGESFSRVYYPGAAVGVGETGAGSAVASENPAASPQNFTWTNPTPGAANEINVRTDVEVANYPYGVALNHASLTAPEFAVLLVGAAAILAALVVYFLKSDENLADIFFGGDG